MTLPRRVEVILNPPGTLHGIRNDGDERIVWLVVQSPPPNRRHDPQRENANEPAA